jgi:hypothetical protein
MTHEILKAVLLCQKLLYYKLCLCPAPTSSRIDDFKLTWKVTYKTSLVGCFFLKGPLDLAFFWGYCRNQGSSPGWPAPSLGA